MSLSDFIQSGSSQRCFSASDRYSACVPCQKEILDVVCSLFSPPRFYVEGSCNNPEALTELTLDKVCMPCDSSKPHSSLILSSEMAYTGWWGHRSRIAMFNAMDSGGNVPWNDRVTCRYGCDKGFTSNNLGVEQYLETPCVACQPDVYPHDCQQLILRQIAAYLPNTHLCGASSNNYAPYLPSCSTCASAFSGVVQDYVFFPQQQLPSSALECLALCASDRYHSLRTSVGGIKPQNFTSYFAKEPIPFKTSLEFFALKTWAGLAIKRAAKATTSSQTQNAGLALLRRARPLITERPAFQASPETLSACLALRSLYTMTWNLL